MNGEGCVELEGGQKQWDETLVLVLAGLTKVGGRGGRGVSGCLGE